MTYHDGIDSVEILLEGRFDKKVAAPCDQKAGWKKAGNKCVRVEAKKKKTNLGLQLGLGAAGVALGAGGIAAGAALAGQASRGKDVRSRRAGESDEEFNRRNTPYTKAPEYKAGDDPFEYVSKGNAKDPFVREEFKKKLEELRQKMREEQAKAREQEKQKGQGSKTQGSTGQSSVGTERKSKPKNFQEEIGLDESATAKEVRQKYIELAKKYHPDVSKDPAAAEKMKDLNAKYEKWKAANIKKDSYLQAIDLIDLEIRRRTDAATRNRPTSLKCKPGYKQQGAVCKPIVKGEAEVPSANGRRSGGTNGRPAGRGKKRRGAGGAGTLIAGAATAVVAGSAVALPLIELERINGKDKKGGVKIPPEGLSPERLANYNKQFEKGDLVRQKFVLPTGTVGYHYGVYIGPDEETGEPKMLHLNPVMEKGRQKGVGVVITGMKPNKSDGGGYEYEKDPDSPPKEKKVDIDKKLKDLEPYIGKTVDFNIFDKNCEAFARSVVGQEGKSLQTAQMSRVGRSIGRNTFGKLISLTVTKGRKNEISLKDIQSVLEKEVTKVRGKGMTKKRDADIPDKLSTDTPIGWEAFLKETEDGNYQIMSPEEVLDVANSYTNTQIKTAYLKGYFLFLAAASYVDGDSNDQAR